MSKLEEILSMEESMGVGGECFLEGKINLVMINLYSIPSHFRGGKKGGSLMKLLKCM